MLNFHIDVANSSENLCVSFSLQLSSLAAAAVAISYYNKEYNNKNHNYRSANLFEINI